MKTIQATIRQHPVLSYFVLTFFISWVGVWIAMSGASTFPAPEEEVARLFPVGYLTTVAGPILASLLLTAAMGGWNGLRQLFAQLHEWRVGIGWYAIALLLAPITVIGSLLALSLWSPSFVPGFLTARDAATPPGPMSMSLGVVIALSLFNGFVEELGWTGFAIPKMLRRTRVFTTGLSVGLLWGAWHFLSNLWLSGSSTGGISLYIFMPVLLFTFLPPYRVLMTWVYEHTQSLPLAMLMHASLNFFWLSSTPPAITPMSTMIWYLVWGALLWIVAALALTYGEQRTHPLSQRAMGATTT
jgi:membrane protease YdiL (CAAX protease family)